MKKIILPIDFSISSEHAAKLASKIARISKSELHVIHMIEFASDSSFFNSESNNSTPQNAFFIKKTKETLVNFKKKFFLKNEKLFTSILFKKPSDGILNYNKKINADLIVMGSNSHSELEKIIIGSNTNKIIQTSKTPVLVVKKNEDKFTLKNLVFASDFNEEKIKNEPLRKLIDLAQRFKATFHLLKINTPNKFETSEISKKKMRSFVKKYKLTKFTINAENDLTIAEGIVNFTKRVSGDIISLESYGRGALSHLINKSITKYVSDTALQPTIIFKT